MKTPKFIYRCSDCGHEEPKWLGRCPECGEWNTLVETASSPAGTGGRRTAEKKMPQTFPLASLECKDESRVSSGIASTRT